MIQSDLCSPMRIESAGRARYFITFIDNKSRWCDERFLKRKSVMYCKRILTLLILFIILLILISFY